eukprot:Pompholyxophrys_sp_v1_NODE_173_length_1350_cov_3.789189.p1 type:complete len:345 gc:universal NODE_173_length_1350_cov_3.789189:211-1245(+)
MADPVVEAVSGHAHSELKYHVIYAVIYMGYEQKLIANIFHKSVSKWLQRFRETGEVSRNDRNDNASKFEVQHRQWIVDFVTEKPLSYLKEIQENFKIVFSISICVSTVFNILRQANLSHRVIERRAIEISFDDVGRYNYEVNLIGPLPIQLCFIDEMSTDNRGMLRKRGWFLRGHRPVFKGAFRRGLRISILSFLGVDGLFETFGTDGTFDRLRFFDCCKNLLDSGKVKRYPGSKSVWILDGAAIHVEKAMIDYFFARGVYVIFLPAYCPFFNPIEIVFGLIKKRCRELYDEKMGTEHELLLKVLVEFSERNFASIFSKCGYKASGYFDVHTNFDDFLKEADLD